MNPRPPELQQALDLYQEAKQAFLEKPSQETLAVKRKAYKNIYEVQKTLYSKTGVHPSRPKGRARLYKNMEGRVFGYWKIIEELPKQGKNRIVLAECGACKTIKTVRLHAMINLQSKSCCGTRL